MSNFTPYQWQQLEAAADTPIWIDTVADLETYCAHWQTLPLIALDTEFQRVETFYPIPGLIQLADDKACYLIDPLAIDDFSALKALFENTDVIKVMHAATEDLELFLNSLNCLPAPLHDTQVAAAFLGWGASMGLQRMLEQVLQVTVAKGETTSNWLQRPLTESQEHYAALDVAYLPALYALQVEQLEQKGMTDWIAQECLALLHGALDVDPEGLVYYQRFSQVWNYPEHKIAALRDLTAWREQTARRRDVPRNRILSNQALIRIIETWPRSVADLAQLDDVKKRVLRNDGAIILSLLKNGVRSAQEEVPAPVDRPLHYFWNKPLKKLKAVIRKVAESYDVPPELLLRRKELEALVRSGIEQGNYRLPDSVSPWRKQLVETPLLAELAEIEQQRTQEAN
ncbi:ribonuclease D [Pontibacter sp. JAM-7]|uniref:ribonuclease D n=1 Tax=Pontibacter sp. JAM-7 TaxID=3366581 RepID=UPI003AF86309